MSVNIYLKPEIKNAPEFRTKTHKDGSQGLQFDGMALYSDKGRLHVMLNEWDIVPPVLEEFVTDVSIRVTAPCESFRRECGVYAYEDAEAEVETYNLGGQKQSYLFAVKAKNLQSAQALLRQIKAGTIRPTESYEGAQQGLSRAELEAKLEETQRLLASTTGEVTLAKQRLTQAVADKELAEARVEAAYKLAEEFVSDSWPWCLNTTAGERIRDGLNSIK